ncbi:hypothetical protein D3C85_1043560 [compost metagenome]
MKRILHIFRKPDFSFLSKEVNKKQLCIAEIVGQILQEMAWDTINGVRFLLKEKCLILIL